jgi:hypothetical protein
MYNTTKALGYETWYIHASDFLNGLCPHCNEPVEEIYADNGHSFRMMDKWVHMVTWWCECKNPSCLGPRRYKAPQPYVLPYKKFGQDVWIFICSEWEWFKSSPKEISQRLLRYGVTMSDDTVAGILDEYRLLREGKIDEETSNIIKNQGRVIIGCDGTPTDTDSASFWTFYDVISGRILHVELLVFAGREDLLRIFQTIKEKYGVPVVGFLSDHQPSIVNACMEFDPLIPHQTCHYHFLNNHWRFIEAKDQNLHKELRKVVNTIRIGDKDDYGGAFYSPNMRVEKRQFFAPLVKLLNRSVTQKNDDFDQLQGMLSFEALERIVGEINHETVTCNQSLRPVKQLRASIDTVVKVLEKLRPTYDELKELVSVFQTIRTTLGDITLLKQDKITRMTELYKALWLKHKDSAHYRTQEDVKMLAPSPSLSKHSIFCQWCRLWKTHQDGLFHYMDVKGMNRTNTFNEQLFSRLRRDVVKAHGVAHEAHSIFTRGTYYVKSREIKSDVWIKDALESCDVRTFEALKEPLHARIGERTATYRNSPIVTGAVRIITDNIRNKSWEK